MIFTGARFSWYNLLFPFVVIQLYLFCIGLGLFLAQASVFFRDLVYTGQLPSLYNVVGGCIAAVVMMTIGVWSFMKTEDNFIMHI